jgi:hypothetical protein
MAWRPLRGAAPRFIIHISQGKRGRPTEGVRFTQGHTAHRIKVDAHRSVKFKGLSRARVDWLEGDLKSLV